MHGQITSFNIYKVVYTICFVLILPTFLLFGQKVSNASIYFNNYDVEDGLPSFVNNCVLEGHRGFLWVGTDKGFSRFDGKEFVNYYASKFGLSFSGIDKIYEDERGELWMSEKNIDESRFQLFRFNPDTEKLKTYQSDIKETISSFVANPQKQIIFGTTTGKLILVQDSEERLIYQTIGEKAIIEIASTVNGYWLNEGKKVRFIDRKGRLVQSWEAEGVFTLVGIKGSNSIYVRDLQNSNKNEILLLKKDIKEAQLTTFDTTDPKIDKYECWYYLSKKEMFVVTDSEGKIFCIDELGKRKFSLPLRGKSADSIDIKDVLVCSAGNIYIATTLGIFKVRIKPSKFNSFLYQEPPLVNNVTELVVKGDSLYCAMPDKEIIFDVTSETIYPNTAISINSYPVSTKDTNGQIWIGGRDGLSYLDEKTGVLTPFQKYNQFSELATVTVFDICQLGDVFWVATDKGLYTMTPTEGVQEWYHSGDPTPEARYLPADIILGIYIDTEGVLWLTTLGSGVIRLNPKDSKYRQIMVKNGLAHNITNAILEDDFDNLWVSTNKGLSCINKIKGDVSNFDKSDGLPFDKFNKNASGKLADGRLVFGGTNGIIIFDPKDFLEKEKQELLNPLRIIELAIDDSLYHALDLETPLLLEETVTNLAFRFRLLQYQDEEAVIYEWKWKECNQPFKPLLKSRLILSDIPRGENSIFVRAKLANGTLASNDLEIKLKMPTFFAKDKIWAGGILIVFLTLFMYRRRKEKKKAEPVPTLVAVSEVEEDAEKEIIEPIKVKKVTEKEEIILSTTDERWLRKVTEIAEKQLQKNTSSVEELAREMHLSSRQLNRKIKSLTGSTPNQFLRGIKLEKAKYLLENGLVATVAETSYAVGFEKPDYFSRLFYDKYGIRPRNYFDKK